MSNSWVKTIISLAILVIFSVAVGVGGFILFNNSKAQTQNRNSLADQCSANGGKWSDQYSECEDITETQCQGMNGTFDSCASPCRHLPIGERACILSCIQLCSFNVANDNSSIELTQLATIEVKADNTKTYTITPNANETALSVLQRLAASDSSFTYKTKSYSFGDLVTSINNLEPDTNKQFWAFKVNGQDSDVGISQYIVKQGDTLSFELTNIQ